jgi:hypothetical protein
MTVMQSLVMLMPWLLLYPFSVLQHLLVGSKVTACNAGKTAENMDWKTCDFSEMYSQKTVHYGLHLSKMTKNMLAECTALQRTN